MNKALQGLGPSSIFLNYGVFTASLDYSWLKPFVLLFDFIVLEDHETLTFAPFIYREPKLYEWFLQNAVILEDFGLVERRERNHRALETLRPHLITKAGSYNKNFLRWFAAKMRRRAGGPSDHTGSLDFKKEHGIWTGLDSHTDGIIINELVDAEVSLFLFNVYSIPSVLDDLQSWLSSSAIRRSVPRMRAQDPTRLLRLLVPNIDSLDWKSVLELRESKHREVSLRALQSLAERPDTAAIEQMTESLWRLVTEVQSEASIGKAVLKGVASNIPFIPINPLSLTLAGMDIVSARRRRHDYAWLFFLAEVREASRSMTT